MAPPPPRASLPGCCPRCDAEVFDDSGAPLEGAIRIEMHTMGGSSLEAIFCEPCGLRLENTHLPLLWQRFVLAWMLESRGRITPWVRAQGEQGLRQIVERGPA